MNRNTQAHFAETPSLNISRSKFDRSFTHKTTFNTGDLVPFFCCDVIPGDTMKMNTAHVVRMMTPVAPVMDNANLDTYFFFVPNRLIWEHWQEFMGENKTAPWIQQQEYQIPQIEAPTGGWTKGSLADYFGYPTEIAGYKADAMPFRAYALIYNEWFRDENLCNPLYIHMGDADITGVDITDANLDPITDIEKGACCAKAAKYADYFTMALPAAQKGPAVKIPIGNQAPIIGTDNIPSTYQALDTNLIGKDLFFNTASGLKVATVDDNPTYMAEPSNIGLAADLSQAVGATINQLRQAFQIQKFYERQAIGGTRYIELIKSHFSVTNPDYRMQRPEYLGGMRTPININQVVQTDATSQQLGGEYVEDPDTGTEVWTWGMSDLTPQGNTSAYSLTTGNNKDLFTHSFTEHGWVIGLAVVRTVHTYQQGLNRMFSRKSIFDYYWPEFANLGNREIANKELYLQGPTAINPNTGKEYDEEVFGYQEAWAEYRYLPDIVTAEMRSNYAQSLDIWHWADDYSTLPALGDEWIEETKENVERTLAVQNHDQFFGDFYFNCIMTRPMPLYSVPGLIDHH